MKIAVGADHGGFKLKEVIRTALVERGIEVEDVGCYDTRSVDYPDVAREVACRVGDGRSAEGVLVCTTGIGMAMAANRFPGVRAALCLSAEMAEKAREHNNANVLVLSGAYVSDDAGAEILAAWMNTRFSEADRHARRVGKLNAFSMEASELAALTEVDPDIGEVIRAEAGLEESGINLIASENYASRAVRAAQGSVMTNKYAEGYPGKRWYNGCEHVDEAERLAIARAKDVFGAQHVNVQPHCGSSANMAVYFAVLEPGDTILAMSLAHGGHLTHGHNVNFSGRFFNVVGYGVERESGRIDYDALRTLAREHSPKMIVAGASAYPRVLDFARFREIADEVGAMLTVDMAHIAGLVAGGAHPSPVPYSDFVTTTTHKTLRGPRSGMILCREEYAKQIDRQVFPGLQGGPLMHVVAAKAVCFREALSDGFRDYAAKVVANAAAMAEVLAAEGFDLVSDGTDNHLMLVDLRSHDMTGRDAANRLEQAGLIVNKNNIPFDDKSPFVTSGIRIGTPAMTTRGMQEAEAKQVAACIARVLTDAVDEASLAKARDEVKALAAAFPVP